MIMSKETGLLLISILFISLGIFNTNVTSMERKMSSENHNPILFCHGWTKNNFDWTLMKMWFENDGWPTFKLFAYTFEDIQNSCSGQAHINYSKQIDIWVDDILNQTGASKIDLVGHSSGGLGIRHYVKFLNGTDKVDDLVTLASPHHWTKHPDADPCNVIPDNLSSFLIVLNEGDETPGGILNDVIGDRYDPILNVTYNATHIPGNVNYTSIYSLDDTLMVPRNSSILEGAYNIEISGVDHSTIYATKFVYELVKEAVNDYFPPPSTTFSEEITETTTSTTSSSVEVSETTQATTPFGEISEILVYMGIIVIFIQLNRRKYK